MIRLDPPDFRTLGGVARSLALSLAGAALFAGCTTSSPRVSAPSLAGDPRLPADRISRFYSAEEWAKLAEKSYDGCVILRGPIDDNNRVTSPILVDSYPDDERNILALRFARKVKIVPTTTATHVRPMARIYVLFYERDRKPRRAIIYAEQTGVITAPLTSGGDQNYYLVMSYY